MIARNDDLVRMRKPGEPARERPDSIFATAGREITRVDEHVAIRNLQPVVEAVCVRDADNSHSAILARFRLRSTR